jgi:SAM-dependent methyltransferase
VPTVQQNYDRWQHHEWAQEGHEWSPGRSAAGSAILWSRTILPRIERYLPTGTILEIGPGFGRWTEFLRRRCDCLILIDLSGRCIDSCRRRFADDPRIAYFVNDGSSLGAVPDGSINFIFSCDSLVHAEAETISAYLDEASRKLKPGGAGFIHHSNLGAFAGHDRRPAWFVRRQHWRGVSMSADAFEQQCRGAHLRCRSQELINWIGREHDADRHHLPGPSLPLIDCLSIFTNDPPSDERPVRILNDSFVDEWRQAVWMADVYYANAPASVIVAPPRVSAFALAGRKLTTAHAIWKQAGLLAVLRHARQQAHAATTALTSAAISRVAGLANRWFLHHRLLRH